jgi:hypothetical protein
MQSEQEPSTVPASIVILLFQVLHVLGVALCLFTLGQMWENQVLLRLLMERLPLVHLLGGQIPMWILLFLVMLIALFGILKVERMVWMWHRGEAIQDAGVRLRIGLYMAMGLLCFCVFVLSTPETFSGPFRLRHPVAAWMAASFAYAAWWLLPALKPRFSSRTRHRLDVICMSVTLALILAEVVLRMLSVVWASPLLVTDSTPSQIRRDTDRVQPGTERFSFPVNSAGHYDTEFLPPSERSLPLVVTIGDTFSYGIVPHHYHFTTVAEREFPGAEIYNMGFPGTNPTDYLYQLVEEALPLKPDLVVIALFVGNDIVVEAPKTSPTGWYDAERYMLGIVWHRLQFLRRAQDRDRAQHSPDPTGDNLAVRYPFLTNPTLESPSMGEEAFLGLEARNAQSGALDHPGMYERFLAALQNIEDAAGDVPLAFLIIPDEYQVNDELWQALVERSELPLQRDLPQVKIREWAQAGNREIVDILPLLLAQEPLPDGQRHLYHLRDGRFNARGNLIAGRALARLIEDRLAAAERADLVTPSPQSKSVAPQSAPPQGATPQDAMPQGAMPQDATPQDSAAQSESPGDQATEILKQFGSVIADAGLDGSRVFDESLLKHPKGEIISAVVIILNGEAVADQKAFAREAAAVLAFFQQGVGNGGIAIDAMRPDQLTWRSVVETEMQKNNAHLASTVKEQ